MDRVRFLASFQEGLEGDVVRIECNSVVFQRNFKKVHTRNSSFKKNFKKNNSASKMANCSIVDIVNYLMLLLANS